MDVAAKVAAQEAAARKEKLAAVKKKKEKNHIEKLDPVLLRSRKMDMHIYMSYCTFASLKVLMRNYLGYEEGDLRDNVLKELELERVVDKAEITPTDVNEAFIKNRRDKERAVRKLLVEDRKAHIATNRRAEDLSFKLQVAHASIDKVHQELAKARSKETALDNKIRVSNSSCEKQSRMEDVVDMDIGETSDRILMTIKRARGGGGASFDVVTGYKVGTSYKAKFIHVPLTVTVFRVKKYMDSGVVDMVYKWQSVGLKTNLNLFMKMLI